MISSYSNNILIEAELVITSTKVKVRRKHLNKKMKRKSQEKSQTKERK